MSFITTLFADKKQPETVDEQFLVLERGVIAENARHEQMLRNLYPHGFFKLLRADKSLVEIRHWCPECKLLTSPAGMSVTHCGRTDIRPKSFLQLLFMPKDAVKWI